VDTHALDQLAELLKRGCDIADGCGRPGWLPRMALNEKTFEEFKHVHDTILSILQVRPRWWLIVHEHIGPVVWVCGCDPTVHG
jgi:hypothetical protein